ncbi:hypothetical protein HZC07_05505 [Candidatus Micrarchaeota archaeon]|nr:hypothetical protein [Candidatus Micrarchaeota archaeon]
MKGYTIYMEGCASARVEDANASYKDLAEVCGSIRNKKSNWAVSFLEKAATGEYAVLFKRHNKRLGHRRELGGQKGRYPMKAASVILKVLNSALANGKVKGMGDDYLVVAASANKKQVFPRLASKGRWARSNIETSRVEILLKPSSEIPKGVTVTPPKKSDSKSEKSINEKKETPVEAKKTEHKAHEAKKEVHESKKHEHDEKKDSVHKEHKKVD